MAWLACAVLATAAVLSGGQSEGSCDAEGEVRVRVRDPRWGGVYEVGTSKYAGERWFRKSGSSAVLYFTGGDEGAWVIGTTLGVRDIQNRIFARLKGPAASLFSEAGLWEVRDIVPCSSHAISIFALSCFRHIPSIPAMQPTGLAPSLCAIATHD